MLGARLRIHAFRAMCAAIVLALGTGSILAQNAERNTRAGNNALAYPTGDRNTGVLLLEATSPAEARVGQAFDYEIKVTNLTKDLSLENVRIVQETPEHLNIESSDPQMDQGKEGPRHWSIDRLGPGQSKVFKVRAIGDREGAEMSCLRVTYQPALCLTTRIVKAEIQVTKEAPAEVDICDTITLRYVVKNTGSATVHNVKLRDELPEGLALTDGNRVVSSDIGDLEAGATKEVTAHAVANKSGAFSSRAIAEGPNDLRAQSQNTTTRVKESKLAVRLDGPDSGTVKEQLSYHATVTNEGDATANQVQLRINTDPKSRVTTVYRSTKDEKAPSTEGNTLTWDLQNLNPGEKKTVWFTVLSREGGTLNHTAEAISACARGRDQIASARVQANTTTQVQTIPALLLELFDEEDPIRIGNTEVYTIQVINQGSGADHGVQVVAHLPEQFEFVNAHGPTKAKADGNTVTFEPIGEMPPKDKAKWTLEVKPVKAGDTRLRIDLSSDYLRQPVTESEPTRLLQ